MVNATVNPRGAKLDGSQRQCRACGKNGHNSRTCPTLGRSKKTSVKSPGVGKGKGIRHCGKCGSSKHNSRTCGISNKTNRTAKGRFNKKYGRPIRRNSSKRRNPDVVQKMPIVGKTGYAKWFDGQMGLNANGAQKWSSQKLTQKAVTTIGGFAGYGYGGAYTQFGQGLNDNAYIGSGIGLITGVAGTTLSSWGTNKIFGEMLFKGHERKHHTFANLTKGWRVGGYIGVGLNTITNLLTTKYGRSYGDLGSWSQIINEASNSPLAAVKKMCMKTTGAHKLAHLPSFASIGQTMYDAGPDGPLQGQHFGNADEVHNHDQATPVGFVDVLGYPSGVSNLASISENQYL